MKKVFLFFGFLIATLPVVGQTNTWSSGRFTEYIDVGSARNTNALNVGINTGYSYVTNIQLAHKTFSGSHVLLFNSYVNTDQVSGSLGTTGNTKYANDPSEYSSGAGAIMFFSNGGIMDFRISPASTGKNNVVDWGTPQLRILRNGNVGIGITSPTHKLTVDGVISAREVKVSNTPNSDYVFEPDYPLLPLSEVETHIKEKKHLPGIPSAEEFKQNGVGLGEMDDMLLRKVEELVLYTIEQQKELEKLKREMENLKQDNVIYKNKNEQQSEFIKQQSELINVLIESKN